MNPPPQAVHFVGLFVFVVVVVVLLLIFHLSAKAYSIMLAGTESVKLVLSSLLTMNVEEKS